MMTKKERVFKSLLSNLGPLLDEAQGTAVYIGL